MSYKFIGGTFRRTVVVGDIHGCWTELNALLKKLEYGVQDLLIGVGDFLDRGPSSWEVARFFRDTANAHSVLGNHERRVAGTIRGTSLPAWTQKLTIAQVPPPDLPGWADYLGSLPAVIETEHVIVTHARLNPSRPLSEQEPYYTAGVGGAAVKIPLDEKGVPKWYPTMKLTKPVCFGHQKHDRVDLVPKGLYALDTGVVRGGYLTAVVFPGSQIIEVPAARDYFRDLKKTVLSGDVKSQRLDRLFELLARPDEFCCTFSVQKLTSLVASVLGAACQSEIRERLVALFGSLPEPGVARGEYIKRLKAALPDRVAAGVAHELVFGRPVELRFLARAFPAMRFGDVLQRIEHFRARVGLVQRNL